MPDDDAIPCELLTWVRFHELCRRLAVRIEKSDFRPDAIVAIARGGYAPARVLCDFLRVMELTSIRVMHYRAMASSAAGARIEDPLAIDLNRRRVLIVDDVTDTGDTFQVAVEHVRQRSEPSEVRTSVLLHKSTARLTPDFWGARVVKWRWVIFPWARIEDLTSLLNRLPGDTRDSRDIAEQLRRRHGLRVTRKTVEDVLRFGNNWREHS